MNSASSTTPQSDSDYVYSPRWYFPDHQRIRSVVALPFSQSNLELLARFIQDTSNPFMTPRLLARTQKDGRLSDRIRYDQISIMLRTGELRRR